MSRTASDLAGRLDRHAVGGHRERDTAGDGGVPGRAGQGRGGTLVATRRDTEQCDRCDQGDPTMLHVVSLERTLLSSLQTTADRFRVTRTIRSSFRGSGITRVAPVFVCLANRYGEEMM